MQKLSIIGHTMLYAKQRNELLVLSNHEEKGNLLTRWFLTANPEEKPPIRLAEFPLAKKSFIKYMDDNRFLILEIGETKSIIHIADWETGQIQQSFTMPKGDSNGNLQVSAYLPKSNLLIAGGAWSTLYFIDLSNQGVVSKAFAEQDDGFDCLDALVVNEAENLLIHSDIDQFSVFSVCKILPAEKRLKKLGGFSGDLREHYDAIHFFGESNYIAHVWMNYYSKAILSIRQVEGHQLKNICQKQLNIPLSKHYSFSSKVAVYESFVFVGLECSLICLVFKPNKKKLKIHKKWKLLGKVQSLVVDVNQANVYVATEVGVFVFPIE